MCKSTSGEGKAVLVDKWQTISRLIIPSPVFAVAVDQHGIWAGGLGSVMWRQFYGEWEPKLALTGVTAIAPTPDGALLGSSEGIVYSQDGGETWQQARMPASVGGVLSIALSPHFAADQTAVAATTHQGILRSLDGGATWHSTEFVIVQPKQLLWHKKGLIAASTAGLYHASEAGQRWQASHAPFGQTFMAVAALADGTLVAAGENTLWFSVDGVAWVEGGKLPHTNAVFSLSGVPKSAHALVLGVADEGLYYSADRGESWRKVYEQPALALATWQDKLLAGTPTGFLVSHTGGIGWLDWSAPQCHDLHHLIALNDELLLLRGRYTTPLRYQNKKGWRGIPALPRPMSTHALSPTGELYIATAEGVYLSDELAENWQRVSEQTEVTHLSCRADGMLFAAVGNGTALLRSADQGDTWQAQMTPFATQPLVALTAMPHLLLAATYEETTQLARVWLSGDDGEQWQEAAAIKTNWPLISAWSSPPLLTIGNVLLKQTIAGWQPRPLGDSRAALRCLAGYGEVVVLLTAVGVWRSDDKGITWRPLEIPVKAAHIVDIAVTAARLYLLHIDGEIYYRSLGRE